MKNFDLIQLDLEKGHLRITESRARGNVQCRMSNLVADIRYENIVDIVA